ncbi:response regulator [Gilvibacter sediminis]|uniref:response regulator n=1 Tax=Gilvibacter sediminis TaxID=379071 RepID=UPI002350D2EF|nr:response regulator [Gilvibacter sediminis]MDC7998050.1 response regulator [Gilvibacter sediminis]
MKRLGRIMLVDDDKNTNFFNKLMLTRNDVTDEIVVFDSPVEGLDYLKTKTDEVDLLFLDINMPIMTGWEFLESYERVTGTKSYKPIVVILSTSLNPDDIDRAHQMRNVVKYINKPLDHMTIQEVMQVFA